MILETLGGTLLGGLFRLGGEWLGIHKSQREYDHEHRMAALTLESAKVQADARLAEGRLGLEGKDLDALIAGVAAQGQPSGWWFADAVSALVRPVVTYWWLALYTAYKGAILIAAHRTQGDAVTVLISAWGAEDMAILSSILSFWFVDRSLRKLRGQ